MSGEPKRIAIAVLDRAGAAVNVAALAAFVVAGWTLWGMSVGYLADAGGMPHLSLDWAWAAATDGFAGERLFYWASAWACAVAAVGCAWMSVLGGRWAYLALRRALPR